MSYRLGGLDELEAEAIHIVREVSARFERPVMLYSAGKDSSCLLHLAQKAFHPGPIPFPLLHVDTTYKPPELYAFRDEACAAAGVELRVFQATRGLAEGTRPDRAGTSACCAVWKTGGLLEALAVGGYDAAIGGARREEERSRAKERIFSVRDPKGRWDPRRQRPELWSLYNSDLAPGESMRVFPLSNWTELDVWSYIAREGVAVAPLYFARERKMIRRGGQLLAAEPGALPLAGEPTELVTCRFRTLGCLPCSGAVESEARDLPAIIAELAQARRSERATRVIDHDQAASMERKKREGYF